MEILQITLAILLILTQIFELIHIFGVLKDRYAKDRR
jgi:hypothetical protein